MAWAAIGSTAVGLIGSKLMGHGSSGAQDAQNTGAEGAKMAQYRAVNSYNPYGSTTTDAQGNMHTTMSPYAAGQANMFTGMADNAAGYAADQGRTMAGAGSYMTGMGNQFAGQAQGAGAQFTGAGNRMLQAMGNFDPQKYANQMYGNMAAMAAPGNTDQTQNMMNYEQASGRNGLDQNGQLGDMGGLALAQKTADNQMRMQAMQMGQSQQQLMGNQAVQFGGMGLDQTKGYGMLGAQFGQLGMNQTNSAYDRYNNLSRTAGMNQGYAQNMMDGGLPYAQLAQRQASDMQRGGDAAAGYMTNGNNTANNIRGAQQGGLNSQLGGVYDALGGAAGKWLSGYLGGGSDNSPQPYTMPGNDQMIQNPSMDNLYYGQDQTYSF